MEVPWEHTTLPAASSTVHTHDASMVVCSHGTFHGLFYGTSMLLSWDHDASTELSWCFHDASAGHSS